MKDTKIKKTKFREWLLGSCIGNFDKLPCLMPFTFCGTPKDGICIGARRYKLIRWLFSPMIKKMYDLG
jgi:hypothetical protein